MTLLTAIFLCSEIAVIKIKARTKRTAPEYQGNVLVAFTQGQRQQSPQRWRHIWIKSALLLKRLTPCDQTFVTLMSLQRSNNLLLNQGHEDG